MRQHLPYPACVTGIGLCYSKPFQRCCVVTVMWMHLRVRNLAPEAVVSHAASRGLSAHPIGSIGSTKGHGSYEQYAEVCHNDIGSASTMWLLILCSLMIPFPVRGFHCHSANLSLISYQASHAGCMCLCLLLSRIDWLHGAKVLLLLWAEESSSPCWQCIELFSGQGNVSAAFRSLGRSVASFDKVLGGKSMDMTENSGFLSMPQV